MIARRPVGRFDDREVEQFTLSSSSGAEVDLLTWGVVVRDWRVPVAGGARQVVLGFDDFAAYPRHSPYFGCIAGRVASRVRAASFELDGKSYALSPNEPPNSLHGGTPGLGAVLWEAEPDSQRNGVRFTHRSPAGAGGYPGNVTVSAFYQLQGNRLRLELSAVTDQPTPLSLAQHLNFNLGTDADVLDHTYWLAGGAFVELGDGLVPTGNIIAALPGSAWDFRVPKKLRDASGAPIDYDASLVLDTGRSLDDPVAVVVAPNGDLTLRLWTDRPALQFYNGVATNVAVPGLGGRRYSRHSNFVLEDQAYPDALHHRHFPSIIITPDTPYRHWCEIEIG